MLNSWMSHDVYCNFISEGSYLLSPSDQARLSGIFSDSIVKLTSLNLDPVRDALSGYYSNTSKPAVNHPQILRSFLLMVDTKETNIKKCVLKLHSDTLLAFLIGYTPDSI